jgi:hypothetical protein
MYAPAQPAIRRDDAARRAADDRAGDLAEDAADLGALTRARLSRPVAQRDVGHLVRHHPGDFAFRLRGFDHAAIEKHRPPGSANALMSF